MSSRRVPPVIAGPSTSGSYPTGACPEAHPASSNPGNRHAPVVVDGSERPFQTRQMAAPGDATTSGTAVTASTDARQLPPSSLSNAG